MPSRSIIRTGVGPHREPRNRFPAMAAAINLLAARAARVQSRRKLSRSLSPKLDHSHSITRSLDSIVRGRALRVYPGTSCGIAEPSQHEADRGKAEEGERLAVEVLPILGQSTAAVQPSYGAFDNPALRENDKPFRLIRALHDFKVHAPQDLFDRTSELRSLVSAIGVELHQKRIAREEHGHQPNAPVAILDIGGVHDRVHQQALRVDEKVTLLAFDPFTRIIARRVDRGPPFSALFTLWLSMIATVGLASREACSRHFT